MFFFIIGIYDTSKEIKVLKEGQIVNMEIVRLPPSCTGSSRLHMKLNYQGNPYFTTVPGYYCEEHKVGDIVKIKYLANSDKILLPFENPYSELIATLLFGIIGLSIITWYGILKKPIVYVVNIGKKIKSKK